MPICTLNLLIDLSILLKQQYSKSPMMVHAVDDCPVSQFVLLDLSVVLDTVDYCCVCCLIALAYVALRSTGSSPISH